MSTLVTNGRQMKRAVRTCAKTLRRIARYKFGRAFVKRLRELSEEKSGLTAAERAELAVLVDFWQKRTNEMLEAQLALEYLSKAFPEVATR